MAVLTVELTKDMLKLVSRFNFSQFPSKSEWEGKERVTWGLDLTSLYGGSFFLEDVSYILGVYDQHIEGTEEDPMGVRFPQEMEDYMWEIHGYILEHLQDIEEIVHQFVNLGGVKPGKYKAQSNERIWSYCGEE